MKKLAVLFVALGMFGCDDSDSSPASDAAVLVDGSGGGTNGDGSVVDAPGTSNSVSTLITAATGGTVKLDQVTLAIPAGALAADTTITIASSAPSSRLPDLASISGMVYEFGPNGTTFSIPVTLTMPISGIVPQGMSAKCVFLDKGVWVELPGSASATTVTCQTTHFTTFAILFVGAGGSCAFGAACGGDLAGTWDITAVCLAKKAPSAIDICKTDTASTLEVLGGNGVLTVTGTSYTRDIALTIKAIYSAACLAPFSQMITTCNDVSAQLIKSFKGTATCTGTPATACTCTATFPQKSETGTVAITGNTAKFISVTSNEASTAPSDYCVKGNALEWNSIKSDKNVDGGVSEIETTVYKASRR